MQCNFASFKLLRISTLMSLGPVRCMMPFSYAGYVLYMYSVIHVHIYTLGLAKYYLSLMQFQNTCMYLTKRGLQLYVTYAYN